jgi:hypothetical protein
MIREEQALHFNAAQYLRLAIAAPAWWSTIGHGSVTSQAEARALKAKGLRRGMPDIMVFAPSERRPDHCRTGTQIRRRSPD